MTDIPAQLLTAPEIINFVRAPHKHTPDGIVWRNLYHAGTPGDASAAGTTATGDVSTETLLEATGDNRLHWTVDERRHTFDTGEAYGIAVALAALATKSLGITLRPVFADLSTSQFDKVVPANIRDVNDDPGAEPHSYAVFTTSFTVIADITRNRVYITDEPHRQDGGTEAPVDGPRRVILHVDQIQDEAEMLLTAVNIYQQAVARQVLDDMDDTGDAENTENAVETGVSDKVDSEEADTE